MYQYVVSGIMHPTKYIITSKFTILLRPLLPQKLGLSIEHLPDVDGNTSEIAVFLPTYIETQHVNYNLENLASTSGLLCDHGLDVQARYPVW